MSESPHTARVRFFNAMAVIALVVCVVAIIVFYGVGVRPRWEAEPPTTRSNWNTVDRLIAHDEFARPQPEVKTPTPRSPFTDLASPNPRLRELALRARPPHEQWLADPSTTPDARADAAEQIRAAFADKDPDVRLAAAEFVSTVRNFPEVKPADAVPVWQAFLTDQDEERRVTAAVMLWERHAHTEAGKVLVGVVKNRAAAARLRGRAAAAVTADPPFARPDGMTAALDAVLVNRTEDKSLRFAVFDRFKRDTGKGDPVPSAFRKSLLKLVDEADPELGYAAVKELSVDLRRRNPLPNDLKPAILKLAGTKTTPPDLRAAAYDALLSAKPDADGKRLAEELVADADAPADARAKAFDVLAGDVKAGQVPDALRPLLVKLAADADTPVKTRIRAFDLLAPSSDGFARMYPELAAVLDKAVSDANEANAFRAFAAAHFKADTAERFATAVEQLTGSGDSAFVNLLADGVAARFPDGRAFPNEWVTDKLAERMAKRAFATATPPARLRTLFADALFAHGKGVVPAVAEGLGEASLRRRNAAILERFGADARPAAGRVFDLLALDSVPADDKAALMRVIAAFGPDEIPNRLKAKGGTVAERVLLLKHWKPDAKGRLALFTELLGHELREVRVWAAVELGKVGPDAKAAIPKLVEQLKADIAADQKAGVRPQHGPLAEALAAIGPDCLPAVTELTTDAEPMVRVAAAEVFGHLGAEVRSKATPLLRKLIEEDTDELVKQSALHALGQVNPKEAEKLGWTPPQARRPDPEVIPVYVDRPVPVYRDPLPTSTPPRPSTPAYKPYTPPYRPVYIPPYRPLYIPRPVR